MSDTCQHHWTITVHVLRYLKANPNDHDFNFSNSSNYNVKAYCDADWVACILDVLLVCLLFLLVIVEHHENPRNNTLFHFPLQKLSTVLFDVSLQN